MTSSQRPMPVVNDPDTGGYFEAARRGELTVCACTSCGTVLHLPRAYCFACGSLEVGWRVVSGRARLYSWTVTERPLIPAFPVPYTVVVVELDDEPGVHLIGSLPGRPELEAGMPMQVRFETYADGTVVPEWEVVQGA